MIKKYLPTGIALLLIIIFGYLAAYLAIEIAAPYAVRAYWRVFPALTISDYIFRVAFAALTSLGILHAWFRTDAFPEYSHLLGFPLTGYKMWLIRTFHADREAKERKKQPKTAKPEPVQAANLALPLSVHPPQAIVAPAPNAAPAPASCKGCTAPDFAAEVASLDKRPDISHIAWIKQTYGKFFFGRLISCPFCLPAPVTLIVCTLAGIPAATPAVWWIVTQVFKRF